MRIENWHTAEGHLRPLRSLALALVLLAPAGCGEAFEPRYTRKPIPVAELPAPVHDAAKKALPEITFEESWKNLDREGTLQSYEVRGKAANGKIREVRVSTTGEVLEME